ncbi:energy-coupling factor transporter ATPase [Paludicola sp. MB14-C6]|uniref:energy-coupling factor transporter ATPase n=1 Tax=Paludihabitans sp. MB14-C6 TaxID=3070656 RepID=UPI0027DD13F5|nr:energy-coupling factor transporter ATPase [Paludicola sp. MB14-C6]WMJ23296.1 energy-coupling factor transporter ATPase [Paludicola sp. MB14-C6]
MSIIKTENLTHLYSAGTPFEKAAIDNINIDIEEGELVGVIGHTGSGKSTLIQHLNGLLKPTSGKVLIDGVDIWESKETLHKTRFKVGLVFQYPEYQLFEETVYKDIAFGPSNLGLSKDEIEYAVLKASACVGLSQDILKKSPFELSGGQKRRVAIAGVIAMNPKVLILDEPTAGLDPKGSDTILDMIRQYHDQEKSTVLLVSHSMEDIAKFSSKVLVMNKSKVYTYGDVEAVFSKAHEIEKIGLSIPQITKVFFELYKRGYDVNPNIYSIEEAKKQILKLLEQRGKRTC